MRLTVFTRFAFAILLLLSFTVTCSAQLPKKVTKRIGQDPALFLDSVEVDVTALRALSPFDIANIGIVESKKAKKRLGDKGTDGPFM